ncbi:hypothetical protein GQX74_012293 [Glossina fuscipes]|nr:hypothetical protein GQX74_012293 [Glossina fuscipes]
MRRKEGWPYPNTQQLTSNSANKSKPTPACFKDKPEDNDGYSMPYPSGYWTTNDHTSPLQGVSQNSHKEMGMSAYLATIYLKKRSKIKAFSRQQQHLTLFQTKAMTTTLSKSSLPNISLAGVYIGTDIAMTNPGFKARRILVRLKQQQHLNRDKALNWWGNEAARPQSQINDYELNCKARGVSQQQQQ